MDYHALAIEMLQNLKLLRSAAPQKNIDGLLRGESFVLQYIATHGTEVLPGEIGGDMHVSTARIAQALNSIEKKGWITRQIDPGDRRKILVRLTPEGKSIADEQFQRIVGIAVNMLALLGEEDAKDYVRISGKLAEILVKNAETIEITKERT